MSAARRNALTPDALPLMDISARSDSCSAPARELGRAPQALTWA